MDHSQHAMAEQDPPLAASQVEQARSVMPSAPDTLLPVAYDELRRIAHRVRRKSGATETLNTTALVHEAYVKLSGGEPRTWRDRAHFLAVAAIAMRQIVIDYARARQTARRGGGTRRIALDEIELGLTGGSGFSAEKAEALIALDASLHRLANRSERQVRIVECRFFAGMSIAETAEALGVSTATVKRGWATAQAWLYRDLQMTIDA
jgi:RNA polymerase sigma factor (TIGR02999 family)